MNKVSHLLLAGAFLAGLTNLASADTLATYTMYDPPKPTTVDGVSVPPAGPYEIQPDSSGFDTPNGTGSVAVVASGLGLGPGVFPNYNFRLGFSPTAGSYDDTVAAANTDGQYLTFSIAPTVLGTAIDLTAIDFSGVNFITDFDGSNPNSETFTLRSSLDNYATDLGSFSGTAFVDKLTGSDLALNLNNLTGTTTFRLYTTGPSSLENHDNGLFYETGLFSGTADIDGTVVLATTTPEPGTFALLGVGLVMLALVTQRLHSARD